MSLIRDIELPGQILLSWFIAGAILTGGVLVAYATIKGGLSYYGLLYAVAGLYMLGGVAGFAFGGALGMFGRPLSMKMRRAFSDQLGALLYALPAGMIGFVIAGWIGLSYWAFWSLNYLALLFVTASWMVGAVIVAIAINRGWLGLENLAKRVKRMASIKVRFEFDD